MKSPKRKLTTAIGLVLILWMAISVSACGGKLGGLVGQAGRRIGLGPRLSSVPTLTQTATPLPTPTLAPTPTLLVPTPASPSEPPDLSIPSEPNSPFQIDLTQQQINDYVASQTYDLQSVEISDIHVDITDQALIADFQVKEQQSGMTLPLTVRGVPQVNAGDLYLRVESFELGNSVNGFTRALARGMIQKIIDQYSTPSGILIPVNNVQFESVTLAPQQITVKGITK